MTETSSVSTCPQARRALNGTSTPALVTPPKCIALASNDTFIAAPAYPSVSLWDTTTHEHIGSIVMDTDRIESMALSTNNVLVMGGCYTTSSTITLRSLQDVIPSSYYSDPRMGLEKADPGEVIKSPNKIARLEETVQQLLDQLSNSKRRADSLNELLRAQEMNSNTKIAHLEKTVQQLRDQHAHSQHTPDNLLQILHAHEQKHKCEALYAEDRIIEAAICLSEITNTIGNEVRANTLIMNRLSEFKNDCESMLKIIGDEASSAEEEDEAVAAYSAALLLSPSTPNTFLTKWAHKMLTRSSVSEVSSAAAKLPNFIICQTICDILEEDGRVSEAIKCFLQFQSELGEVTGNHDEKIQSGLDFKMRSLKTLEQRGDVSVDSALYKDAVVQYTIALALDPLSTDLLT
ncbi:hypothetical protein J3R82DRAFT_6121 [Butyriboletus roseoflavus]|nr:hypothetical protein J3R82DRAFT_6121 [Butyriboletus roseoflavus]